MTTPLYIYNRNQTAPLRQAPSVICTSDHITCRFKYTSKDGSFHGHLNIQGIAGFSALLVSLPVLLKRSSLSSNRLSMEKNFSFVFLPAGGSVWLSLGHDPGQVCRPPPPRTLHSHSHTFDTHTHTRTVRTHRGSQVCLKREIERVITRKIER